MAGRGLIDNATNVTKTKPEANLHPRYGEFHPFAKMVPLHRTVETKQSIRNTDMYDEKLIVCSLQNTTG